MRSAMIGLVLGAALATSALAAGRRAAVDSPVVVELFTSQGCSSCPPADAFLTDLAHTRRDVLPLAFHVTYWNSLGWKDPYSLEAATARQRDYARDLGDDSVYTPEMVVDGARGFVGSDRARGLSAIAEAAPRSVSVGVTREGQALVIHVGAGTGQARVLLVGFDPAHRTHIGRGENGGRTLLESNIVRSVTPVGPWAGSAIAFRRSAPAGESFAVLVQAEDGRIIGAGRLGS